MSETKTKKARRGRRKRRPHPVRRRSGGGRTVDELAGCLSVGAVLALALVTVAGLERLARERAHDATDRSLFLCDSGREPGSGLVH